MPRYTGVHSNDTSLSQTLTIRDGYISYTDRDQVWKHHIPTDSPSYRIGIDNSGGKYEVIEFLDRSNGFYDSTIIGRDQYKLPEVTIQTWDRKTYFISGVKEVKRVGRGRNSYYPESSSNSGTIIDMSDDSATKLAQLFDSIKK